MSDDDHDSSNLSLTDSGKLGSVISADETSYTVFIDHCVGFTANENFDQIFRPSDLDVNSNFDVTVTMED